MAFAFLLNGTVLPTRKPRCSDRRCDRIRMHAGGSQTFSRRGILHGLIGALVLSRRTENAWGAIQPIEGASRLLASDLSGLEKYLPKIQAGYDTLLELQKRWEEKTAARDGDVIRRMLGTVGVTSPLLNIRKAFEGVSQVVFDLPDVSDETIEALNERYTGILDGLSSVRIEIDAHSAQG